MISNSGKNSVKSTQEGHSNSKGSEKLIRQNIEDHILRQIYPNVRVGKILGNPGMHESALAMAAVVLDDPVESKQWLDFVLQPGETKRIDDPDVPYGRYWEVTEGNILPQLAFMKNGNSTSGLHKDIFSSDPETIATEIENVINTQGPLDLSGTHTVKLEVTGPLPALLHVSDQHGIEEVTV